MTKFLASLAGLLLLTAAAPAPPAAKVVKNPHVELELSAETASAAPGSTVYVSVRESIIPHWHTYWRNAGDSGEPTTIKWTLPPGWKAGEIVWPAPSRLTTGPLVNYVFSDTIQLPTPIEVPADARPGSTAALAAHVDYLVCADVCVPESADLKLDLPIAAGSPVADPKSGAAIAAALAAAPKPAGLKATFAKGTAGVLRLSVTGAPVAGADAAQAWFYPYDGTLIDHAKPQTAERGPQGLTLTLPAGFAMTSGPAPQEVKGVLALGPGRAWEVTARPGPALAGATGSPAAAPAGGGGGRAGGGGAGALPGYAAAAFLGGLILNLMPCVFPVLSIKAAQLARHGGDPGAARAEGLAFLAGVVATFVALAAALLIARAGGEAVGWGFQLQSPAVVAVLALIMLAAALNLSGVFEVGTAVQGAGSGLAAKGGLAGAFFTGALAVVVAAPCSAPFMAGAIGWAVTQPPAAALLIFVALGLGLAFPFTLIAFVPAVQRRLPKPGAWMDVLRQWLAFPMYGAAAWLAWVFALQTPEALPVLFAAAVLLAFGLWIWGAVQRQRAEGASPTSLRVAGGAAAVVVVGVGAWLASTGSLAAVSARPASAAAGVAAKPAGGALAAEPWSPERVAALRAEGRPVFVDFTAAWCVTCQVNERTALAGPGVAQAFARHNAVYLKADWTKRDGAIAKALSEQGRSGVPLYLVYGRDGPPAVLPQLLTEGLVVEALAAAAEPARAARTAPAA